MTINLTAQQVAIIGDCATSAAIDHLSEALDNALGAGLIVELVQRAINNIANDQKQDGAALLKRPEAIGKAVAESLVHAILTNKALGLSALVQLTASLKSGAWHQAVADVPAATEA